MEDIIISQNIQDTINTFKKQGVDKLHVLADFDQTLTKSFINGKHVPSIISILRDNNYLTPDYPDKAKALYAKYHPIEIDPNVSIKDKKSAMENWWTEHFNLLIKSGLSQEDIRSIVDSGILLPREGAKDFFGFCHQHKIPIVILTSCGIGGDPVRLFLQKQGVFYNNVDIISNSLIWDEKGNAIDFEKPTIHSMNKDETLVKEFPVFEKIKARKNVLLLGNSLGDPDMIKGFEYDNLLKVGFLNEKKDESLEKFKKLYDVIILNDGTMSYINDFLISISEK